MLPYASCVRARAAGLDRVDMGSLGRPEWAMPRAFRLLFLIPALLLALGGCTPPANRGIGGVPNPTPVRALVSLSPSTTEIISGLTTNRSILRGRTKFDTYPPGIEAIPIVAEVKPDYEKIAKIKPDLILYDASLYTASDIEKLKQLNIPTYAIEGNTVTKYVEQIRFLGMMIAAETTFNDYADKVESALSAASADPPNPQPRVAVMMAGSGSEHMITGTGSFQADVIKSVGGIPVGPDGDKFVNANPEELIKLNPDVIITSGSPDPILADPRLKTLKAVTSNRVFGINSDVLLRRGARVDALIEAARDLIRRK
jgi:iron complex transport system substrate-binding protein